MRWQVGQGTGVVPWPATVLLVAVLGAVLAARDTGAAVPASSVWVVLSAGVAAAAITKAVSDLDQGWAVWRRVVAGLAVACVAYPGLWAVAVLTSTALPDSVASWLTALMATTAHLPLLAAFSVLPLSAMRYLGQGSGSAPVVVVTATAVAAFVGFAAFYDDYAPLRARALLRWDGGDALGASVHLLFLATVLLGPVMALRAAWRSDGQAARRLALVAGSALAGTALVMVCGMVGSFDGIGAAIVLAAMPVAAATVGVGCTVALTTRDLPGVAVQARPDGQTGPAPAVPTGPLTPRESEVVGLLAEGLSNAGIAARLVVSERTVDAHLRSAFTKLALPEGPEQNRRVHAVLAWQDVEASRQARSGI